MEVRITKTRVALAALFVLAGVGLASLLSPLVGTALANVGQVVNISDHSASAYFAKVDSSGALRTSVSGPIAPTLPRLPFNRALPSTNSTGWTTVLGPTTATVALTDLKMTNPFQNTKPRELTFIQYSAPAPNPTCAGTHSRNLGFYDAPVGVTVNANFATPLVLKPLASGEAWCLKFLLLVPTGENYYNYLSVSVGGYVPSGDFSPWPTPAPPKTGVSTPERNAERRFGTADRASAPRPDIGLDRRRASWEP